MDPFHLAGSRSVSDDPDPGSALKLRKSDLRNRIKADVLDALLLLKSNGDYLFKN